MRRLSHTSSWPYITRELLLIHNGLCELCILVCKGWWEWIYWRFLGVAGGLKSSPSPAPPPVPRSPAGWAGLRVCCVWSSLCSLSGPPDPSHTGTYKAARGRKLSQGGFLIAITMNASYWDQQINVLIIKKKSGRYILYASCTWGKWELQNTLFHWRVKDTWMRKYIFIHVNFNVTNKINAPRSLFLFFLFFFHISAFLN